MTVFSDGSGQINWDPDQGVGQYTGPGPNFGAMCVPVGDQSMMSYADPVYMPMYMQYQIQMEQLAMARQAAANRAAVQARTSQPNGPPRVTVLATLPPWMAFLYGPFALAWIVGFVLILVNVHKTPLHAGVPGWLWPALGSWILLSPLVVMPLTKASPKQRERVTHRTKSKVPDPAVPDLTLTIPPGTDRNAIGDRIAACALKAKNEPYVSGGESIHHGFDCSGLVDFAFKCAGVTWSQNPRPQAKSLYKYALDHKVMLDPNARLRPGDVLFFGKSSTAPELENAHHVGIVESLTNGDLQIISAGGTQQDVHTWDVTIPGEKVVISREALGGQDYLGAARFIQ